MISEFTQPDAHAVVAYYSGSAPTARSSRIHRRRDSSRRPTRCSTRLPLSSLFDQTRHPHSVSFFFSLFVLLDRHQIVAIPFRFPSQVYQDLPQTSTGYNLPYSFFFPFRKFV